MHCLLLAPVLVLVAGVVGPASGQDAQDEVPWNDPVALQADLDSRSPQKLLELAVQVERVITRRVLTPDPTLVEGQRSLLELPDTGVARLLDRTTSATLRSAILTRGHGAYYSFATRLHSYDAEPDLELQSGNFSGGVLRGCLRSAVGDWSSRPRDPAHQRRRVSSAVAQRQSEGGLAQPLAVH